jgi:hypothetical protein
MNKKSYIDPITDYLLHDPEQISSTGSIARGALTAGGLTGGALGAGKLVNVINNSAIPAKIPGKAKIGLMLGSALGLGGAGHWFGSKKFNYTPEEQLHNKLDSIKAMLAESGDSLKDIAANAPGSAAEAATSKLDKDDVGLWEKITNLVKPKSSYDKFKESGKAMWENLKDTGVHGWEALKDAVT